MPVIIANREDPDQTARSSLIWVCPVCLSLFGRQLVFEILEHLLNSYTEHDIIAIIFSKQVKSQENCKVIYFGIFEKLFPIYDTYM